MIFNSQAFLVFAVAVLVLYYALRSRVHQNVLLLVSSYVFYGFATPRYVLLLLFYTFVNYHLGGRIERSTGRPRRMAMALGVIVNLGVLCYFKYAGFFLTEVAALLEGLGFEAHLPVLRIVLPVGISFYAFQSIAYLVDIYRGELAACRKWVDFALFEAFFPQLVAGPIERGAHMLPQLANPRRITRECVRDGVYFLALGFFLKCAIADRVAPFVNYQFDISAAIDRTPEGAFLAVIAFGIQIYCDFAGYTYIALGMARLMGFELTRNFLGPYLATSIQDFWRRWHVTLSVWLRDYLYIPLGGSRIGPLRTYVNLMITMGLGGLWHGASWNFIFWGLFHGGGLALHRLATPWLPRHTTRARTVIGQFLTLLFVMVGWSFFRAHSIAEITTLYARIFDLNPARLVTSAEFWVIASLLAMTILIQYVEEIRDPGTLAQRAPMPVMVAVVTACVTAVCAIGFSSHRFIYFEF